jgi:hypothetical protein
VIEAINAGQVPKAFQEVLTSRSNELVNTVNCPQPPPPPPPPPAEEDENDNHGKGKGKDKQKDNQDTVQTDTGVTELPPPIDTTTEGPGG